MNKKLTDILYNPSDLCTVYSQSFATAENTNQREMDHNDLTSRIFEKLTAVVHGIQNRSHIIKELTQLSKYMHFEIPKIARPTVFEKLNEALSALKITYHADKDVYLLCFEITTLFKTQIDKDSQGTQEFSEKEWVELEKCVYLLCDWEDEVIYKKGKQETLRAELDS